METQSTNLPPTATAVAEPYTETYRVLKRLLVSERDVPDPVVYWREVGELGGTSYYGHNVTAQDLGDLWGEGQYLFFKTEGYARMEQMTVVAEATFRRADSPGSDET